MEDAQALTVRMRPVLFTWIVGLFAFYLLALDQGQLLSLVQGSAALDLNLIHEFLHDARHAAGFPCH